MTNKPIKPRKLLFTHPLAVLFLFAIFASSMASAQIPDLEPLNNFSGWGDSLVLTDNTGSHYDVGQVYAGKKHWVQVVEWNNGAPGATAGMHHVKVTIKQKDGGKWTKVYEKEISVSAIPYQGINYVTSSFSYDFPYVDTYSIQVKWDSYMKYYYGEVYEGDEYNNTRIKTYDVVEGPLSLTSINPNHGPMSGGNSVYIEGSGFYGEEYNNDFRVVFGGKDASSVYIEDYNNLECQVPSSNTSGQVTVQVISPQGQNKTLYYTYDQKNPILYVSKTNINFGTWNEGQSPPGQIDFYVQNQGGQILNWSASANKPWLSLTKTNGALKENEIDNVYCSLVPSQFPGHGPQNGTITITGAGSTKYINVDVNCVSSELNVSPQLITFDDWYEGQTPPANKTFDVQNIGYGAMSWSASENIGWLKISPTNGNSLGHNQSQPVTCSIEASAFPGAGHYSETVTVTDLRPGGATKQVVIEIDCKSEPAIKVTPLSIDFGQWIKGDPPPSDESFQIENIGYGDLYWTASESVSWFHLSDYSGGPLTHNQTQNVTCSITPGTYPGDGVHNGIISIPDPNAPGSPIQINVTIEGKSVPELEVTPLSIDFGQWKEGDPPPANMTFEVKNVGEGLLDWDADESIAWLEHDPSSGKDLAKNQSETVTCSIPIGAYPGHGDYNEVITITSNAPGGAKYVSVHLSCVSEPVLDVTPLVIDFGVWKEGMAPPAAKDFEVKNIGYGALSWSASETIPWLDLSAASGSGLGHNQSELVACSILSGQFPGEGTYNETISVIDVQKPLNPIDVTIILECESVPILDVAPLALDFIWYEGKPAPAAQDITIKNIGYGLMNWDIIENIPWLTANPMSGQNLSHNQSETVSCSIDGTYPGEGTYPGVIVIKAPNATPDEIQVAVNLECISQPVLQVTPSILELTWVEGHSAPSGDITITNIGYGVMSWIIDSKPAWLDASPSVGNGLAKNQSMTSSCSVNCPWPGLVPDYTGKLILSSPEADPNSSPAEVDVVVHFVAPPDLLVPENYPTIQAAIDMAKDGDTVLVAPGVYTENIHFSGKKLTLRSDLDRDIATNDMAAFQTFIDGANAACAVLFDSNEDENAVIMGFTIRNGLGSGTPYNTGGGITCDNASPTIMNNIILDNSTTFCGGGILCKNNSNPKIIGNMICENTADVYGGGLACVNSSPFVLNNTISHNEAAYGGLGGGLACDNASPTLKNCILWDNMAGLGLEIYVISGAPTVSFSNVKGGWPGSFNLIGDGLDNPLFSDPINSVYSLDRDSPCINRGENTPDFMMDVSGDPVPHMGTVDMGADEFSHTLPLESNTNSIPLNMGGTIILSLDAGSSYGLKNFIILGSLTGNNPGDLIPNATKRLPIHWDIFTNIVCQYAGSPIFINFIGVLNPLGKASAIFDTQGPLPSLMANQVISFAYLVEDGQAFYVSNPINLYVEL